MARAARFAASLPLLGQSRGRFCRWPFPSPICLHSSGRFMSLHEAPCRQSPFVPNPCRAAALFESTLPRLHEGIGIMTFAVRSLGPVVRRRRGRLGRKRVRRSERLSARPGHSGQQLRRVFADGVEFTVPRGVMAPWVRCAVPKGRILVSPFKRTRLQPGPAVDSNAVEKPSRDRAW